MSYSYLHHRPRLIVLGVRGIPAAHGGFETFVERLAIYLRDLGWDVTVYCQGSDTGRRYVDEWAGIRRIHIPVRLGGSAATIEFDTLATIDALKQPGMILTLGYNTGFLSTLVSLFRRPNIINMDGLEWKREKYGTGARAFLWVNERLAAWAGTRLIADHPVIADHLATRASAAKITMIPYGGDPIFDPDPAPLAGYGLEPDRFMTLIARPVPENSILEIVRGFSATRRDIKLVVLGKYARSDKYQRAVLDAAGPDVLFAGAIYDAPTLRAMRFYSLAYLHGHRVGGTNPSLVEALGAANAVIAHDNPFNRWVVGDAGVFFANEAECAAAIKALIADPARRDAMRDAARARWEQAFQWPTILDHYAGVLDVHRIAADHPAAAVGERPATAVPRD